MQAGTLGIRRAGSKSSIGCLQQPGPGGASNCPRSVPHSGPHSAPGTYAEMGTCHEHQPQGPAQVSGLWYRAQARTQRWPPSLLGL